MAKTKTKEAETSKESTTNKSAKTKTVPTKETTAKKPGLEKVSVTARQIGKNLNVVVGNEKFTRMGTKEELEVVKDSIKAYDAKPTKANMDAMMKLLRPETAKKEAEVEKVKADIKATKKKVAEEPKAVAKKRTNIKDVVKDIDEKEFSKEELEEMKAAIARQEEKKASAPTAKTSHSGRRGEY